MIPHKDFCLAAASAAVLLSFPTNVLAMYSKDSPVLQVNARNYDDLIAKSNHTSILEFYAPWCGHCKNLKPAYEKAAKSLAGLAKVAAIDCDEETNKAFCGSMGVQGFPTLKIIRPAGSKKRQPNVEDYRGERTAKAIVDAVIEKIPNHMKRIGDKDLDGWLKSSNGTAKAILFSSKGTTSALLKSLAVDFLGGISFAQIRDKEKKAVEMFGVDGFPKLVLLPGGDKEGIVYDGPLKREPMVQFLSQVTPPNPDPAPKKAKTANPSSKKPSKKESKKSEQDKATFEQASSSHASQEASGNTLSSTKAVTYTVPSDSTSESAAEATESIEIETIILGGDEMNPTAESPDPMVSATNTPTPRKVLDTPPPIPSLDDSAKLREACLKPSASTCVLALLPAYADPEIFPEKAASAQSSLAQIAQKYAQRHASIFPFYTVPSTNDEGPSLRSALGLKDINDMELIAVNARRGWWRRFAGDDFGVASVEGWIDSIRLGEGKKEKLPEGIVVEAEAEAEAGTGAEPQKAEKAEEKQDDEHDEL
ncbi:MAG: hypothetical protein M1816_004977 [Peltula sp. TS41687]|nr:MAG: hypothetical protein M1816_004977 [Peltula sp. TS41687]